MLVTWVKTLNCVVYIQRSWLRRARLVRFAGLACFNPSVKWSVPTRSPHVHWKIGDSAHEQCFIRCPVAGLVTLTDSHAGHDDMEDFRPVSELGFRVGIRRAEIWKEYLCRDSLFIQNISPIISLAKSTRIINHNQLLMTKFGRILRLINRWRQKCSFLAG